MSLSPAQLELLIKEAKDGSPTAERNAKRAKQILPVRQDGNLLLCTVLLGNVAVNSCMAVFLDSFTGGAAAFVITTLMVVTFGEIIPQALCYKHGLVIGAALLPILKVFLVLFYVVNKPVALLLDRVFGQEEHGSVLMNCNQMKAALDYQMNKSPDLLARTESRLLKGALESSELSVKDVMVPIEDVSCLDAQAIIDENVLKAVSDAGYSRLPVVDYIQEAGARKHARVIGHLHVRDLLITDPEKKLPVKSLLLQFPVQTVHTIDSDESFLTLLHALKNGSSHLTCVRDVVGRDGGDREPYWYHSGIVVAQDVLNAVAMEDLQEEKDQGFDDSIPLEPGSPRMIARRRRKSSKQRQESPGTQQPTRRGCGFLSMLCSVLGATFGSRAGQTEATPLATVPAASPVGKLAPKDGESSFPVGGATKACQRV